MTKTANIFNIIAQLLSLVGGVNWGLIGLFDINLIQLLFNNFKIIQGIYILVGISSFYFLIDLIGFIFTKNSKYLN